MSRSHLSLPDPSLAPRTSPRRGLLSTPPRPARETVICAAERSEGLESGEPVTIGDDVWIGGRTAIIPGVSVGDGSVVAAVVVVVEDVPAGVVVVGNPATVVRELDDVSGPAGGE